MAEARAAPDRWQKETAISGSAFVPNDVARGTTCAIAIMAKASRPGACKTRLTPWLSADEAAAINTCFLQDIAANIAAAARVAPIQAYAAYAPLGSEPFFEAILPAGFRLYAPPAAGIGPSLVRSARDLLEEGYGAVCLVNADSPTLPTRFLVDAARRLAAPGDRVVLGPCADGGYYLIGLKRFHERLFEAIDWSTERVLTQTIDRAAEIGLAVDLLPPWYDVDEPALFHRLCQELAGAGAGAEPGFAAPATRDWLARALGRDGADRFRVLPDQEAAARVPAA